MNYKTQRFKKNFKNLYRIFASLYIVDKYIKHLTY